MTVTTLPELLTVSECAERIGHTVSERTLWREIARGHLVARRIGRCVRIVDTELVRWIGAIDALGGPAMPPTAWEAPGASVDLNHNESESDKSERPAEVRTRTDLSPTKGAI